MKRIHYLRRLPTLVGKAMKNICRAIRNISRRPTQKEFVSEFELIGGWRAIHNYMDDNNMNALDRANKIIIF